MKLLAGGVHVVSSEIAEKTKQPRDLLQSRLRFGPGNEKGLGWRSRMSVVTVQRRSVGRRRVEDLKDLQSKPDILFCCVSFLSFFFFHPLSVSTKDSRLTWLWLRGLSVSELLSTGYK